MTKEEKARAYDEALKDMRVIYPNLKGDAKLAVEHAFPQLTESEDERARKFLVKHVSEWIECIEHDLKLSSKDVESEEELAMFKACLAYLERLKEYEITEEDKKIIPEALVMLCDDIINHRVHTPIKTDEEGARKIKAFLKTFNRQPHKTRGDWEKQKEQKPAEKQDYSGLNDLERAIHRGFLCAGVENVPVTIINETAKECLEQMKPAEWSKEDENMRWNVISIVGGSKSVQAEEMIDWLKSLRPQPHWKPSKEQMDALERCIDYLDESDNDDFRIMLTFYEQLVSL